MPEAETVEFVRPKRIDGNEFPVQTFQTAAAELRRPFSAEAVRFKVQTGKLVVPYIDARLVIERLNLVCPQLWSDTYEKVGEGLLCKLTIDGITREDVGSGYKGKGLFSDALKRAAVKFGVGVSIYALPTLRLDPEKGHLRDTGDKDKKGRPIFALTDKGEEKLAAGYSKWLEETGEKKFGPVLDHGDLADSIGDVEAAQPESGADDARPAEDPRPQKLTDERAVELITQAEETYAKLPAAARKGFTKATFQSMLAGAWHSHEALEALIDELAKRSNDS